jgi:peptidyl-prolyl cis-trans isomerase D
MAVLSKIRQRSILLIGIIGFCLLAFIICDIIKSGGFGVSKNVGSVNGTDIPAQEFLESVNNMQTRQQGISATQAANNVWDYEVQKVLLQERFDKAGIRVGRDHVLDIYAQVYGQYPQFMNALGKFDKAKFNEFLVNMKSTNPQQYQAIEKERPGVEASAKRQLYTTMLKAGFFTTNVEGMSNYKLENDKASFDYVFVPYNSINDDQVKVSDEELTAYMKKNEKKYKSEATRDIEFVFIENKPSAADEAEMKKSIDGLLVPSVRFNDETKKTDTIPSFANATNNEEFVNVIAGSEMKYDTTYVTKKQLPIDHAEQIFNLAPGQVYGPYTQNGYYVATKMVAKKPGVSTKVSHILVAYKGAMRAAGTITRTKEEAKALADGYLAQVNANPAVIDQLARTNSDDPGAVQNGGVYDVTADGGWAQQFKDFAVASPKGKTGVVETDFGYHVMRILEKEDAVRIANIAQKIQPSEATTDANFTKATKLEMDSKEKPLADLAKGLGYTVMPANGLGANDENIQGVGPQRAIVRWAFNNDTKVGDVKKFDTPQGHVIARLKNVNEKGLLPIEEAKVTVLPIVRNQKKAALIRAKMTGATLEAVSQKSGSAVANAPAISMANPMISGIGPELKVVGKAFGLAAGKTSGLIDGEAGVFMVRTKAVEKAPGLPNYSSMTTRVTAQGRGGVETRLTTALKDDADIEDNRFEFN